MVNVFYSTFLNVYYFCHVLTFFNVFLIFPGTLFTSMSVTDVLWLSGKAYRKLFDADN